MPTLAAWTTPENLPHVEYACETLEDIRRHVVDGYLSVPRIGAGVGGFLLGQRTAEGVRILGLEVIPCSHASGPSFSLTPAELAAAAALASTGRTLSVVGLYVSRMRGALELSEREAATYQSLCPEPWQIALVLQPSAIYTTKAALCQRDSEGVIVTGDPVNVDVWVPSPEDDATPEAAATEPPSAAPPPAPAPSPDPATPTPKAAQAEPIPTSGTHSHPREPQPVRPESTLPAPRAQRPAQPEGGTHVDQMRFGQGFDIPDFEYNQPATSSSSGVLPIRPRFAKEPTAPPGREVNQSTAADPRAPGVIPIRPRFDKADAPVTAPAGITPGPYAGPYEQQPKGRRFWGIVGSTVVFLLILFAYLVKDAWLPKPVLKLDMSESHGTVTVTWNREAVAGVEQASLILNDGGQLHSALLDRKQLGSGQYQYNHKSDRVTAIMRSGDERVFAVWDLPVRPPDITVGVPTAVTKPGTSPGTSDESARPAAPKAAPSQPQIPTPAKP
jgi:hypothetical protein